MPSGPVEILVCTTCRNAQPAAALLSSDGEGPRAGQLLARGLQDAAPTGTRIVEVECLSNCSRGCTIALRAPGRWTYVYGNLDPVLHLGTVLDGAAKYVAAADGLVPWRERPEHFRKNCIARIPPLGAAND